MPLSNYLPSSRISQPGVCTSSTRPTSPYQGQVIYQTDTNTTLVWNGSGWVLLSTGTSNPVGMEFLGVFNASNTNRSLAVDNVFSSLYSFYQVIGSLSSTVQTNPGFFNYINTSGSMVNTGIYYGSYYGQDFTTASTSFYTTTLTTVQYIGYLPNNTLGSNSLDFNLTIYNPFDSSRTTSVTGQSSGVSSGSQYTGGQILGTTTATTAFRGLQFDNGGAGNLTGTVSVYGFRK